MIKKLIAAVVFSFALYAAPQYFAASRPDVEHVQVVRIAQDDQTPAAPQPSQADQAAYDAFQQWASDHMLQGAGRYHASEDGKTITGFDLALVTTDADGSQDYKWIVYGYPTVAEAATQIESDFTAYPDGHQTDYVAPDSSTK